MFKTIFHQSAIRSIQYKSNNGEWHLLHQIVSHATEWELQDV